MEQKYRVEGCCKICGQFLIGTNENPHMTIEELRKEWVSLIASAPLHAPSCPKCKYSTDKDYNAGLVYWIDNGKEKILSKEFWEKNK